MPFGFKGDAVNKQGQLMSARFSPLCHLYEGKTMLLEMSRQCRSCFQIPLKWQTVNEKKMKVNKNSDSQAMCI